MPLTDDTQPVVPSTTESTPPESSAPVATEPAEGVQPSTVDARGPIPYDRHEAILRNARSEYAWVKEYGLDRESARYLVQLAKALETDFQGTIEYLQRQGERLGMFKGTAAPEGEPQPDLKFPDGTLSYSAEQHRKYVLWQQKQLQSDFESRLGPLEQKLAMREVYENADRLATENVAKARQWPHFQQFEPQIRQYMEQNNEAELADAYINVVVPQLQSGERQTVLNSMNKKAGASSERPGRTQQPTAKELAKMSTRDVVEHFGKQLGIT